MRKINSDEEILTEHIKARDEIIIDVGCGTGDLVRWMASLGKTVFGIDVGDMIKKAKGFPKAKDEEYIVGTAQQLPFENNYADIITYIASFHHIPADQMKKALSECHRVLKPSGKAILIEPFAKKRSYYEIIRLVEDEAEIQNQAYEILKRSGEFGLGFISEDLFYLERSFGDYINLLNVFIDNEKDRKAIIEKARERTRELCKESGTEFDKFLFKSIARLIILEKTSSSI